MYVEPTPTSGAIVKEKVKRVEVDDKRRWFNNLDRKMQAYVGLWQYSDISIEAVAFYQYLLMRQGSKTHAFPSVDEIKDRFGWHGRKVIKVREELMDKLPEVFEIVQGDGKRRHSYYVTPYAEWPVDVCRRLWFGCHSTVERQCHSNVERQGAVSGSDVERLHGDSNGDSNYGLRESEAKAEGVCQGTGCNKRGDFPYLGKYWCCGHGTECHQELYAKYGLA